MGGFVQCNYAVNGIRKMTIFNFATEWSNTSQFFSLIRLNLANVVKIRLIEHKNSLTCLEIDARPDVIQKFLRKKYFQVNEMYENFNFTKFWKFTLYLEFTIFTKITQPEHFRIRLLSYANGTLEYFSSFLRNNGKFLLIKSS